MHAHALKRALLSDPPPASNQPEPRPDADTTVAPGRVIQFKRPQPVNPPAQLTEGADPDSRSGRLAQIVESLFTDQGMTLTDPQTAAVYDTAFNVALLILDGAHATGQVDDGAHSRLRTMMTEAQHVPEYL